MDDRLEKLIRRISPDQLPGQLRNRGNALRGIAAGQIADAQRTELRVALQALVDRAGRELVGLAEDPADAENGARAVRNSLEANLIGRYCIAAEENLANWLTLRVQEEIDILQSLLTIQASGEAAQAADKIRGRILELQAHCERLERRPARRLPKWRRLAQDHGLANDYDALYGLFSKYVHPSAWSILKPDQGWARTFSDTFVIYTQLYAVDLAARTQLGIDEEILVRSFEAES